LVYPCSCIRTSQGEKQEIDFGIEQDMVVDGGASTTLQPSCGNANINKNHFLIKRREGARATQTHCWSMLWALPQHGFDQLFSGDKKANLFSCIFLI
jgi:hypothetical protein